MLSRFPVELEVTGSVEVTDCCSRMFVSSPQPNEQPLCHAVLASLTITVNMSSQGKQDNYYCTVHYFHIIISLS